MNLINFGFVLKELRISHGLTQEQLALQMGISKSVVSFYERQERLPSPAVIIKLTAIFHVSADYLLGIDEGHYIDVSGLDAADEKIVRMLVDSLKAKHSA